MKKDEPLDLTAESIRTTALKALMAVAGDALSPAAARAAASRTLLEAIGTIGRLQDSRKLDDNRAASEMTPTEISEEIARLSSKIPPVNIRKLKMPGPK
jgi:hypothetical protein